MRKLTTTLTFASIFFAGVMTAPSLYAQGNHDSSGSMMGNGVMGDKNTNEKNSNNDGGMMGDMMGMMKMMTQMSQMMDRCNNMMSDSRPNDQWQRNSDPEPEKKG